MKSLKKLLPLFAFVLGLGLVFTQSAFKSGTTTKTYQYDQDDATDILDRMHWIDLDIEDPLICSDGDNLPCTVQFDTGTYADIDAFLTANNTVATIYSSGKVVESKENVNP